MTHSLLALFLLGALQAAPAAGDAEQGKKQWQTRSAAVGPNQTAGTLWCNNCHGMNAEGGFGPDLAGRGLSVEQVRRAVRQPWGIMPRYPQESVSDATLANLTAWFASLPKVAAPAAWKTPLPPAEPRGPYVMTVSGCYQCHGAQMGNPRRVLGGEFGAALDFPLFTKVIYNHNEYYPQNQMGLFSRDRLTEPTVREIYQYLLVDLGIRVPVSGRVTGSSVAGGNASHVITVSNDGEAGKGLTAEDITVSVPLPTGGKVVSATGPGYEGVKAGAAAGSAAVWRLPRLGPTEKVALTLTLSGDVPAAQLKGASVQWAKPALGPGAATKADSVMVAIPTAAAR
ncbi:MAG: c-type cytochrome [Vicinamibacterales bacterium]